MTIAMTNAPSIPIPATTKAGWAGCHKGVVTPGNAPRPKHQANALTPIQVTDRSA
jgi:hypothetical protein